MDIVSCDRTSRPAMTIRYYSKTRFTLPILPYLKKTKNTVFELSFILSSQCKILHNAQLLLCFDIA